MARFSIFYTEQAVREAVFEADSLEDAKRLIQAIDNGDVLFEDVVVEDSWQDGGYDFDVDTLEEVK